MFTSRLSANFFEVFRSHFFEGESTTDKKKQTIYYLFHRAHAHKHSTHTINSRYTRVHVEASGVLRRPSSAVLTSPCSLTPLNFCNRVHRTVHIIVHQFQIWATTTITKCSSSNRSSSNNSSTCSRTCISSSHSRSNNFLLSAQCNNSSCSSPLLNSTSSTHPRPGRLRFHTHATRRPCPCSNTNNTHC